VCDDAGVSAGSTRFIVASAAVALVVAVVWLGAPLLPAVLGAIGAGLVLYWRGRKTTP
jgi:hypothetical protein